MKLEFDDWAVRTIELSDRDGRASALLNGLACVMPFFKGSPAQTVDLAHRCLAIAGDDDELAIPRPFPPPEFVSAHACGAPIVADTDLGSQVRVSTYLWRTRMG